MGGFNDLETSLANSNTVFGYLTNVIAAANADGCITVLGIQPLGPQSDPTKLLTNNLTQYTNWLGLCAMLRTLTNQTPSCPAYIVDVAAHYAEYTWLCDNIHPDNLANASIAALYDQVLGGRGSHISQNGTTNQPSHAATIFDTANVIASTFTGSHTGSGAGLTNLDASKINNANPATLTNSGNTFAGNGAGLTNLSSDSVLVSVSGVSTVWHRNGSMWWWSTGQQVPWTNLVSATTNVLTIAVPGGVLGSNGTLNVSASFLGMPQTNAFSYTLIYYGGTTVCQVNYTTMIAGNVNTPYLATIINSGSPAAQVGYPLSSPQTGGGAGVYPKYATFNTSTNFVVTLTVFSNPISTNALSGAEVTLRGN
jgi:hypothetical protein